jgi:hypothetical protein
MVSHREISVYTNAPRQVSWIASSENEKMG